MWNRDKEKDEEPMESTESGAERAARERKSSTDADRRAVIGESITIEGQVTGDEDLTIQGHVDGSVNLDDHAVTVGPDGKVEADIIARVITVEGYVDGDLDANEQVVLRGTARVEGDISAPRVVLDDGSYFRGAVDMGDASGGRSGASGSGGSSSSYGTSSAGTSGEPDDDE